MCKSAAINFSNPVLGELRTPDNDDNKAADGCLRGFLDQPLYVDVTIANPTGSAYIKRGSAQYKHLAIDSREEDKMKKYEERCRQIDSKFMPLAFEIYGSCSKNFEKLLSKIVHQASQLNHIPYSCLLSYWKKRISTTLQVYNVRIINCGSQFA